MAHSIRAVSTRVARVCRLPAARPTLRPKLVHLPVHVVRAAGEDYTFASDESDDSDKEEGKEFEVNDDQQRRELREQRFAKGAEELAGGGDVSNEKEDEDFEVDEVQQQRQLREQRFQAKRMEQDGGDEKSDDDRKGRKDEEGDGWEDKIIELNRVTKVLKGGKLMKFRACVVSGNHEGEVGYGVASAREVVEAVNRASAIAKKTAITVPMSKGRTFPHKIQIKEGAARIMLRPASEGTGVIAGGSVRVVLEMAGYQNAFGKIYGTSSAMNNTRGTIAALSQMFTWKGVAKSRGCTIDYAMGRVPEPNQIFGAQSSGSPQTFVVDSPAQETLE